MEGIATEQQLTAPTNLPGIPAADAEQTPAADAAEGQPAEAPAN